MRYWLALLLGAAIFPAAAQLPPTDQRGTTVFDLNTPRTFGACTNQTQWNARQWELRSQILVSCGLWPMPERTPLSAKIFDLVDGEGFTVEKVQFQPFPGVFLAGNLYRPKDRKGPFPAILCPHGHWENGRLQDTDVASVPARCIQLARMGFVVFSHDMIGYNDTAQFTARGADGQPLNPKFYDNHVAVLRNPALQLWNLSLLGQQVWNCLRAVDFLASLPDVDRNRIGCTGASGGGTQTFLLAAIDNRIKVSVPAVMVSHTMQGGCFCENAPGLRVIGGNVDFAAVTVPRPQLLIAATGDWTKTTLEVEGPDVAGIYELMGASNNFAAVRFDYPHNYNRTSREAMYPWFARWLQGRTNAEPVSESPYVKPADSDLRVFPDGRYPGGALSESEFVDQWIRQRQDALDALKPTDLVTLTNFQRTLTTTWQRTLALDGSERTSLVIEGAFGRSGKGDRLEKRLLMPDMEAFRAAVILVHPAGKAAIGPGGARERFAATLVANDIPVLAFDAFQTGPGKDPAIENRSPFTNFFNTYNRTVMQERVQDILTAITYTRQVVRPRKVILVGDGFAGLWTLLAARAADVIVADADGFAVDDDQKMIAPDAFVPGLRLLGGFDGAAALAAPKPMWVHHTTDKFLTPWLKAAYGATGATDKLRTQVETANERELLSWIVAQSKP